MPFWDILGPPCTISPYFATFELEESSHRKYDVKVTLQITYHVFDAPKAMGFKFVGEISL